MSLEKGDSAATAVRYCEQLMQRAGVFYGHGAEHALDESVTLVCHVLEIAADDEDWSQQVLGSAQADKVLDLLRQRTEQRIPLAYLTGVAWFAGLQFKVDPMVLIPRSPIGELIENRFELWIEHSCVTILDLCTGGGCIAIACAAHLPGAKIDAADLSAAALRMAKENLRLHNLEDRVCLYQSDLFEQLGGRRYDLIVSNPPYVGEEEMAGLPQEYLKEPAMALASGVDGLEIPLKILRDAVFHLEDNGVLIMEVGNSDELLQTLLPRVPFVWLEFEYGGHGVLVLDRRQLQAASADILQLLADRELTGENGV